MVAVCLVMFRPAPAQPVPGAPDGIRLTIKPPPGTAPGQLTLVVPKAKLLEEVRKAIPESVALPDQKLGNGRAARSWEELTIRRG